MVHARVLSYALAVFTTYAGFAFAGEPDDKPITIPLDQVWASNMPGTRDVRELEPDKFGKQVADLPTQEKFRLLKESLMEQIGDELSKLPTGTGTVAGPAFAVLGTGVDALQEAKEVLIGKKDSRAHFPTECPITVVFFSHQFNYYVHIREVQRRGNTIEIHYHFVPHRTKEMTAHIALIPLGKLPVGTFKVEIVESPMEKKFVDAGFKPVSADWASHIVCGSFALSIQKGDGD